MLQTATHALVQYCNANIATLLSSSSPNGIVLENIEARFQQKIYISLSLFRYSCRWSNPDRQAVFCENTLEAAAFTDQHIRYGKSLLTRMEVGRLAHLVLRGKSEGHVIFADPAANKKQVHLFAEKVSVLPLLLQSHSCIPVRWTR